MSSPSLWSDGSDVMMADDPLTAVVMGAGKALDEITLLREVAVH